MERSEVRQEIAQFCRQLILSQYAVRLCDVEAITKQEEFLYHVFREELEHRERMRKTRFPVRKTLEGYDLHALCLPKRAGTSPTERTVTASSLENVAVTCTVFFSTLP